MFDRVTAKRAAAMGGEQRRAGIVSLLGQPVPQDGDGVAGQRDGPVLAALAVAGDVRAGAVVDVGVREAEELGDPQPGLHGQQQQGVVASSGPGGRVAGAQQCLDFGFGEIADQRPVEAWAGSPGPGRWSRRVRGGPGRRSGTANGSRPVGRCGCGRCCRAVLRGGRGSRRSAWRPGRRYPARTARRRCGRWRSRAAAAVCRGRRRRCCRWRGAGGSADR